MKSGNQSTGHPGGQSGKISPVKKFLQLDSAGGLLLMGAAALALIIANTPLEVYYQRLLSVPLKVSVGSLEIGKPLLLWINDGLMAVFFFMVGLELKRELLEGELSDRKKVILPGIGAVGGMLFPALIFVAFNYDDPDGMQGWAIPAATDIAFALGVLSLLGNRIPVSIKVFLTSLAIFDDIGAVVIIALFFTSKISLSAMAVAGACIPVLWYLNRRNVVSKSPYILIGIIMWVATLKSGVHATLSGIILAMFIPMRSKKDPEYSPVRRIEHDLHNTVAFFILPVFAFANAGIDFRNMELDQMFHSVPLGIMAGLFIGKQVGIFSLCWLAIKLGIAKLPTGINWTLLYGAALLCGIGFTMSLFIGSLAFEETGVNMIFDERLGIILGSLLSALLGVVVIKRGLRKQK